MMALACAGWPLDDDKFLADPSDLPSVTSSSPCVPTSAASPPNFCIIPCTAIRRAIRYRTRRECGLIARRNHFQIGKSETASMMEWVARSERISARLRGCRSPVASCDGARQGRPTLHAALHVSRQCSPPGFPAAAPSISGLRPISRAKLGAAGDEGRHIATVACISLLTRAPRTTRPRHRRLQSEVACAGPPPARLISDAILQMCKIKACRRSNEVRRSSDPMNGTERQFRALP